MLILLLFSSLLAFSLEPNFPDPMVLKSKGTYYAYATGAQGGKNDTNIVMRTSKDLHNWSSVKEVLPVKPGWARRTTKFWAPHVVEKGGKFIMFFSAEPDSSESEHMRLAIAVSDNPEGPFRDIGAPMDTGDAEENIDPMIFSEKGRDYLYWGRNGVISVQELSADLLNFRQGSQYTELLHAEQKPYEEVVEGPWVMKKGSKYFLFYSGDDCCVNPRYGISWAVSESPFGPFVKKGLLTTNLNGLHNIGHNSVVEDQLVFHGILPDHQRNPETGEIHRILGLSPLEFHRDQPVIK